MPGPRRFGVTERRDHDVPAIGEYLCEPRADGGGVVGDDDTQLGSASLRDATAARRSPPWDRRAGC
jgi:hypothetical protein